MHPQSRRTCNPLARRSPRPVSAADAPISVSRGDVRPCGIDLTLVMAVLAFAIGLSMVAASLAPLDHPSDPASHLRHARGATEPGPSPGDTRGVTPARTSPRSADGADWRRPERVPPPATVGSVTSTPFPRGNVSLFPQGHVTLWDWIRVSSPRDRRAFLMGTSIQLHAPTTAATPGTQFAPPACCPRTWSGD